MGGSRKAGWIGGAVVLIVLTFVVTWFLGASPRFDAAARTLAEAREVESRNTVLEARVASLRADFASLDEFNEELEEFRLRIPSEAQLAAMVYMINEQAVANQVTIVELSAAPPIDVLIPTPVAVAEPVAEPTTEDPAGEAPASEDLAAEDAEPEGQIPPVPTTPAVPTLQGFVAVPLVIKVLGTYPSVIAFLEQMQTGIDRLFLVTGLSGVRQENQPPASGKPATVDGDLELQITGYAYVLENLLPTATDGEPAEPDDPDSEEPDSNELPRSDRNPFIPLVPSATQESPLP